jgi:hypothetical protein
VNRSGAGGGLRSGRGLLLLLFVLTLPLVTPRIRGADEIEGFAYLRSAVFDRDLDFEDEYRWFHARDPEGLAGFKATFLDRREPVTGRPINFAPLGSALLWSPFYLAAHAAVVAARALGAGVAADGYSWPYAAAACFASALYGLLGLLLVHDALVRFGRFADTAAALAVAALWLGTPVLYYMTVAPAFSHAASLFAVALVLWLWLRARARVDASLLDWAAVGAAAGLAGLVREQDMVFVAVPAADLAWRVVRGSERIRNLLRLAVLGGAAAVAVVPQLLAYHAVNGRFGPSHLVARKMSYASPHFLQVLFDPAHGLFAWSPLLLVATAGLLVARVRRATAPILLLAGGLLLQVWINGAVESWTQAGAFGSRRFVSSTAVFAWGLAALVDAAQPRLGRAAVATVLAVFVWWNVSLMVQFGLKLMDRQGLEWPRVAENQVSAVPRHVGRAAWLFLTDRERLVEETR